MGSLISWEYGMDRMVSSYLDVARSRNGTADHLEEDEKVGPQYESMGSICYTVCVRRRCESSRVRALYDRMRLCFYPIWIGIELNWTELEWSEAEQGGAEQRQAGTGLLLLGLRLME